MNPTSSGVYKWTNLKNGKVYIGSAASGLLQRFRYYLKELKAGRCHNKHLQYSWDKYGAAMFRFSIIEKCAPQDCLLKEQLWIDYYQAYDRLKGYNICKIAGSPLGIKWKHSEEAKAKISASRSGKRMSEEQKEKLSLALQRANTICGTRAMYLRGCKCFDCKKANANYCRSRNKRLNG